MGPSVRTLALSLAAALAACGGAGDPNVLRVGTEAAYPPFESALPEGGYEGLDMDLVTAFGEHLGRPVEIQNLAFDTLLLKLQAGNLDVVISGLSYTEKRSRMVE